MQTKPIYIALTTHNAQMSGYNMVLAAGHDRSAVEAKARAIIGDIRTDYGTDLYRETEHQNLVVVSKTRAKREYGFDWEEFCPDPTPAGRYEWVEEDKCYLIEKVLVIPYKNNALICAWTRQNLRTFMTHNAEALINAIMHKRYMRLVDVRLNPSGHFDMTFKL